MYTNEEVRRLDLGRRWLISPIYVFQVNIGLNYTCFIFLFFSICVCTFFPHAVLLFSASATVAQGIILFKKTISYFQPMETVLRKTRKSTGVNCGNVHRRFGVSEATVFTMVTRYVFLIFYLYYFDMVERCCKSEFYLLQELQKSILSCMIQTCCEKMFQESHDCAPRFTGHVLTGHENTFHSVLFYDFL